MNGTQAIITIAYALVLIPVFAITWKLVRSTRGERAGEVDASLLARRENGWAVIVVACLVLLLGVTISSTPYFTGDSSAKGARIQKVSVDSVQFAWVLKPNRVKADTPVEFRLRSRDVNHAFALYKGNELEVQVQVPPKRDQRLRHTFDEPGTYRVVCIEFCGLNHHLMQSQLQVTR